MRLASISLCVMYAYKIIQELCVCHIPVFLIPYAYAQD